MQRIYSNNIYETKDKTLLARIQIADFMYEQYKNNKELKYEFNIYYKSIGNFIRAKLQTKGLIGIAYDKKNNKAVICEFPIESTESAYFDLQFDKELNNFYIEI